MAGNMSYNGTIINDSATIVDKAGADITSGPFTALAFNAEGALVTADGTLVPFGITIAETEDTVKAGEDVTIQIKEMSIWKSGGAFKAGDPLASDGNGCAVKAEAGKFIFAFALEESTAADQLVRVQITKSGYAA